MFLISFKFYPRLFAEFHQSPGNSASRSNVYGAQWENEASEKQDNEMKSTTISALIFPSDRNDSLMRYFLLACGRRGGGEKKTHLVLIRWKQLLIFIPGFKTACQDVVALLLLFNRLFFSRAHQRPGRRRSEKRGNPLRCKCLPKLLPSDHQNPVTYGVFCFFCSFLFFVQPHPISVALQKPSCD